MGGQSRALQLFRNLFKCQKPAVIGMIHCKALPGTPNNEFSIEQLKDHVKHEADIYKAAGVDGVIVENMHDIPYVVHHGQHPEVTAAMAVLCSQARTILGQSYPMGCQVLACGNKEALSIALAADLQFIRAEAFVYGHIADEGYVDACAGDLLRFRKNIGATDVMVWTDIKKKHSSHSITSDVSLSDTAKAASFFSAEALVVTGTATGEEADRNEIEAVQKAAPHLPLVVGSGVTLDNVEDYMTANGLIVGSHFKENGRWDSDLSKEKVVEFVEKVKSLRQIT